ncbi:WD domain G-beta repeat [Lotmaria passim]
MELDNLKEDVLMGDTNEATVPAAVLASAPVLDIGFHPTLPILAAGLVTGEVEVFERKSVDEMVKIPLKNDFSSWIFKGQYNEDEVVMNYHHQNMLMHPSGGVSSMEFTDDGAYLVTASGDRTISVMDCVSLRLVIHIPADEVQARTSAKKKTINAMNKKSDPTSAAKAVKKVPKKSKAGYIVPVNPHKFGISAMNVCDENLIATGDDDGLVAVWDMRERKPVHVYHEHGDYVSQLCYFTDVQELVSSSGDTCLGAYDMRAGKIRDFSAKRKDELNCFAFINSSGISNAAFIPSIICGTPHGGLPIWKYGSWSRPYDVLERHPAECESIISFHGENTAFNHNLILTGACDGLVRVLQMYPVRRNLCQLSARDYTYSHASVLGGNKSTSGGSHHQGNYVVRRTRGQEAITRMRVSHDANLLAVSGADNIVDFVDIAFLNNEEELDQLRGRAERRHLRTIRELDRERDEADERERRLMEGRGSDSEAEGEAAAKSMDDLEDDEDDSSSLWTSSSNSSEEEEGEDKAAKLIRRAALREKLLKLGAVQKRRRSSSISSSDDEEEKKHARKPLETKAKLSIKHTAAEVKKNRKNVSMLTTSGDDVSQDTRAGGGGGGESSPKKSNNKKPTHAEAAGRVGGEPGGEQVVDSMEAYRTDRQKKRERAAAARWLKEERRKKINFTYEKRRRRVGGFFGDMVGGDDD